MFPILPRKKESERNMGGGGGSCLYIVEMILGVPLHKKNG